MNPFNKKFWFVWAETVNQICFTSFIKHGGWPASYAHVIEKYFTI
jgi:hypothetical protein